MVGGGGGGEPGGGALTTISASMASWGYRGRGSPGHSLQPLRAWPGVRWCHRWVGKPGGRYSLKFMQA